MNVSLTATVNNLLYPATVTEHCYIWAICTVIYLSQEKGIYKPTTENFLLGIS